MTEICDLKGENLNEFEKEECQGVNACVFCPTKLRILGLLWCDGSAKEKAEEFYDIL